jgi:hypothetical protein
MTSLQKQSLESILKKMNETASVNKNITLPKPYLNLFEEIRSLIQVMLNEQERAKDILSEIETIGVSIDGDLLFNNNPIQFLSKECQETIISIIGEPRKIITSEDMEFYINKLFPVL